MRFHYLAMILLLGSRASGQIPTPTRNPPADGGIRLFTLMSDARVQFLVTARDELTREPIQDFSLQLDPQDDQSSGGSVSGSGVLRASISGGRYAMLVSAKGYLTEVLEGIDIPGQSTGGTFSNYPINEVEPFSGITIGLNVSLRKLNPAVNRKTRRRPFLSDTAFYDITSPAPELRGGSSSLLTRIRKGSASLLGGGDSIVIAKSWFTAFIDKTGRVVQVKAMNRGRRDVDQLISDALYQTKFTPGQILGKPVNSKIMIPFELTLKPPKK
jgi:hypothetical protein